MRSPVDVCSSGEVTPSVSPKRDGVLSRAMTHIKLHEMDEDSRPTLRPEDAACQKSKGVSASDPA